MDGDSDRVRAPLGIHAFADRYDDVRTDSRARINTPYGFISEQRVMNISSYQFTLIVEGPALQSDTAIDALFDAGCDDALVGRTDAIQYLDFDRDGPNPETAILSAIADVERLPGVEVIRLAGGGLFSMVDIGTHTGRSRESIRLLVTNERSPGGFPAPVTDPRTRY